MSNFEDSERQESESSNADKLGPYDISFGDGIEGRGLDYFTDYEPSFAVVDSDANAILERILEEFGSSVENSDEYFHANIDGSHYSGDAQFIMENCTEEAIWGGLYFGYIVAKLIRDEVLPN